MLDMFIIISKYLFVVIMAVFIFNGFMINLTKQGMAKFDVARGLSNQRICITLFHILASVILISNAIEFDMRAVAIFCSISFLIITLGGFLSRIIYPNSSHMLYNCIFFLMDIGLIMLYRLNPDLANKQLIWNSIGIIMLIISPKILTICPRLDKFRTVYIIIAILLLISTLAFGFTQGGSTNWISLGPIGFQPSELIKIFFIFYLAASLPKASTIKELAVPVVSTGIIVLFLVVQKDLGSSLIFYMTFLVMLFIATSSYLYFVLGLGAISLASVVAYFLFSHIRVRVEAWLNPWSDVGNTGYQIAQSLFAICTWGPTGSGLTKGYSLTIPVVERDFIFSAICEEFGIIFAIGLILIFVLVFLEGARGALENHNKFLTLLCAGITALFAFQAFLIIGGVIKMIPLTGVTLPFVSYGGTSIVISYIMIAIMQWIIIRNEEYEPDKSIDEISITRQHEQIKKRIKEDKIYKYGDDNNINSAKIDLASDKHLASAKDNNSLERPVRNKPISTENKQTNNRPLSTERPARRRQNNEKIN